MAPALLALVTFGLALSMGAAMAPATDSVMSAVPEAKAGVGSAMSDVTRQVGGALGVAVIGSIIGSAYSGDMTGAPAGRSESVGAAHAVAQQVGGKTGRELADTAGHAFTEALGIGLTAAAAVALAGALLVLLRLPSGRPAAAPRLSAAPACLRVAAPQSAGCPRRIRRGRRLMSSRSSPTPLWTMTKILRLIKRHRRARARWSPKQPRARRHPRLSTPRCIPGRTS